LLDEALARLSRTGARYCEAELLRIDGELRLVLSRPDQGGAEASFQRALEIARRQRARTVELRAAVSLARLWADTGKRRQAHDLLTPIRGWFTEGFAAKDLVEAKDLLDTLV
jgi:predicted ATPase